MAKRLRYRIESTAVATLVWVAPRLPRRPLVWLAQVLGSAASVLDRRGRSTAIANLELALPHLDDRQIRSIVRRSYVNFARSFLDLFWFRRLNAENYGRWVDIEGVDPEENEELRKSGGIHLTPHFGNFEWGGLIRGFEGFRMHVVAQNFKNPDLTERFSRLREHSGHCIIPQRSAMLRLMKVLKRGGHVALLTDLNVRPGRSSTVIQCFGLPTCVTRLHVDLAHRCQQRMVTGICEPTDKGRYRVRVLRVFYPPPPEADAASLNRLVQEVWDVFEPEIRRRPELWMWMYKHWRYRPDDDPSGFPAYANRSGAFARLLRAQQPPAPAGGD